MKDEDMEHQHIAMKPDRTVYLRFRKQVMIHPGEAISLGKVAQFICDPSLETKLQRIVLKKPQPQDGNMLLIDILTVINHAKRLLPDVSFELFGESQVLVQVRSSTKAPRFFLMLVVWLLLFIGSGLAILNFHEDVGMQAVHERIYELMTGQQSEHPYWLQIPYAIGLGVGMIVFFNHLFKKKLSEEPSPLDVEMYLYQENLNQYMITEEYSKQEGSEEADGGSRS